MPAWLPIQRRRTNALPLSQDGEVELTEYNDAETEEQSSSLLVMAQHHLLAFIVFMYLLLFICRYGFGWVPGKTPPPPTITVHLRGITDDDNQ